jgi:hypothetical protein
VLSRAPAYRHRARLSAASVDQSSEGPGSVLGLSLITISYGGRIRRIDLYM